MSAFIDHAKPPFSRVLDLSGQRFGRLTVIARAPNEPRRYDSCWRCLCECGAPATVRGTHLKTGAIKSCGCLRGSKGAKKTGKRVAWRHPNTLAYRSWRSMIDRCRNPKQAGYANYGGRGISVCARWARFENFLADMGDRPAGTSIDRINNDGNYEPGNCRWATRTEQSRNRSFVRPITFRGETLTIAEWAEKTGVNPRTIRYRLNRGRPPEEILKPR